MKPIFSRILPLTLASLLIVGIPAQGMQRVELEVPTTSATIVQSVVQKLPTKAQLITAAKKAAVIASLDVFSESVANIARDYFGSEFAGQLTAATVNAYMLTQLKAIQSYRNGNLSIKDILPIDIVMNADGITSKPVVSGLLTLAGFAYIYGSEYGISPIFAFSSMVALKMALFKNDPEAIAYNMSSNLSSMLFGKLYNYASQQFNVGSLWDYAKGLVSNYY